jgi:hypothetical protein
VFGQGMGRAWTGGVRERRKLQERAALDSWFDSWARLTNGLRAEEWIVEETMPAHSTNYANTFIAIAPDSAATEGVVPPLKEGKPSVAWRTWQMIAQNPYKFTSDEVIFGVFAERNGIPPEERSAARDAFFSKGQACLRASDLCKKYGWGIHHDAEERVALYPVESSEYAAFVASDEVDVKRAMRSAR